MPFVRPCSLPPNALLSKYAQAGAYTDCYTADIVGPVSQAAYVEAFYTSWLFKLERLVLALLVRKPSTDARARELASGVADSFAAWRVEARNADQLLMCDFLGRTRSWLMTGPSGDGGATRTRLHFGTAVAPVVSKVSGRATMGFAFKALVGFHRLYSRALLYAARARLGRIGGSG
jgi:hypothetical protein